MRDFASLWRSEPDGGAGGPLSCLRGCFGTNKCKGIRTFQGMPKHTARIGQGSVLPPLT